MRRPLCLAVLGYVFCVLFLLHFYPVSGENISEFDGQNVCVEGIAADKEYRTSEDGSVRLLVTIRNAAVRDEKTGKRSALHHNVLCRTGDGSRESAERIDESICIGDAVLAEGTLRSFHKASNSGEFDADLYYRTLGCSAQMTDADLWPADGGSRKRLVPLSERLHRLRKRLCRVLDQCVCAENAGILKAMLLGEKGSLDSDIKKLYQINGIIHILAISGLHISFLGMGFYRILQKLLSCFPSRIKDFLSAAAALIFLAAYGQMTGMGASSFRAIVMFSLRLLARCLRRTYDLLTALGVACILLVVQQPLYLLQSGFLFSFSAVLGIGLLTPAFSSRCMKGLSVSLAALPIYLLFYYRFPVYSVLLNIVVIPLAGTVMAGGMLALVLGSFWIPAGAAAGMIPSGILTIYERLCILCEKLPGQQVNLGAPKAGQVVIYILILALIATGRGRHFEGRWRVLNTERMRIFLAAAAVFILCLRPRSGLSLHVIDVGQGDGLLIQAEGENLLVDGGSTDQKKVGRYRLIPLMQYYGVREVSCIVTHEDEDHISGIRELLSEDGSGIQIKALYLPSVAEGKESEAYRELENLAEAASVPVVRLYEGVKLQKGRLQLSCLHPEKGSSYEESNERSVALYLTYGKFTCLLNGDLDGKGEERLLDYMRGKTDKSVSLTLLHTAHHGSNGATSAAFLECFRPIYAYVSCGEGNSYGHPGEEAMNRLRQAGAKQIFDTRMTGEITFHVGPKGKRLTVKTWKGT